METQSVRHLSGMTGDATTHFFVFGLALLFPLFEFEDAISHHLRPSNNQSTMSMEESVPGDGGYNRPRRPNPDTISYLRSLPLDIQASSEEITRFLSADNDSDEEYPQSLSATLSAIDEVRNEVASLAGDEFGSQCIEILTRIAAPYSAVASRTLLNGLAGYHVHLATHRYGSHVVQTILQLSVTSKVDQDLAVHEEAPQISNQDDLPSLSDLILGVVDELSPHASQLAVHVCGSHVLRTLLCVLGGVELVQSPGKPMENRVMESGAIRRGKPKKKKKKKTDSGDTGIPHAGLMHMIYQGSSRLDTSSEISDALQSLTEALSGGKTPVEGPGELQQMACHPSAGPLLIVLLRVLTYSSCSQKEHHSTNDDNRSIADHRLGINRPEPTFEMDSPAHVLVRRLLCWQTTESASQQKYAGDVIYGLSGEPRGSHVLETLMRSSHNDVYASILQCGDFTTPSTVQEYAEHNVSNFVVQNLLSTVRTKEQAETLLKSLERLISSGYLVDPLKKRRAILWRAVEMSAKYRVGQDTVLKVIRMGFATLAEKNGEGKGDATRGTEEGKKKKKRKKASSISMQECVTRLIDLKPPEKDGDRVVIDVAGARTVHHLLRFAPRLCGEILDGIVENLSHEELELIANDGLASRCIMDGILDSPIQEPVFAKAAKDMLTKLSGRWVALSVERVGHHTVKKLFRALPDMDGKAMLAAELAQGTNRLSGNAMGRSVMEECCVKEFMDGEKSWKDAVNKKLQKEEWLKDIVGSDEPKEVSKFGKKKRKRKRHGSSAEADKDDGGDGDANKKEKRSAVESIMKTLSMPASAVQN